MLRSMTGFGQAETETERYAIKAELKSLNNKFLELSIRLPKAWQNKDTEVRKEMTRLVERGSCQVNVQVTFKRAEDKVLPLNRDVARYYLKELTSVAQEFGMNPEHVSQSLVSLPNLFQPQEEEQSESDTVALMQTLNKAFEEFEKFRIKEGEMLQAELTRLTRSIQKLLGDVAAFEGERMDQIRSRMEADLAQLKEGTADKGRFEQELLFYMEKLDITEEKTRLDQHCKYFLETIPLKSSGKKLGFIAQEMGREINTIGSKANHFKMQQRVVEMKDELEKIKEQINNVI